MERGPSRMGLGAGISLGQGVSVSAPGSGEHCRSTANMVRSENCRVLTCGGLCGGRRQNHLGAPQNYTSWGLTQGGPGICHCTKLPGDFVAAHFSFRVLLKPNPSPVPFSDEKIKAQGAEAWPLPTE